MTLGRQLLSAFIQLGSVILLARLLGAEGMGKYALTILIPHVLVSFLNLGLPASLVYFIASGKYSLRQSIQGINRFFIAYIPAVLIFVFILFYFFHELWFPQLSFSLVLLAFFCIPFMLVQAVQIVYFQAREDFKKFNYLTLIQPISFIVGVLFLWTSGMMTPDWVVTVFLLSQMLVWWVTRINLNRIVLSAEDSATYSGAFLKDNINYGLKAYMANITSMISYRADLYLVGLLISASSAGVYAIALQISERLFIISQAVSIVLLPRLSGLGENPLQQTHLTSTIARWTFIFTVLAGIALFFVTKWLLVPFFGEDYRASLQPLFLLIVACSFSGYARVVANALAAKNKPEWNLYIGLVAALANVVLNIILIPKYGIMGAAYATCFSFGLNFILKIWAFLHVYNAGLMSLVNFSNEYTLFSNYLSKAKGME